MADGEWQVPFAICYQPAATCHVAIAPPLIPCYDPPTSAVGQGGHAMSAEKLIQEEIQRLTEENRRLQDELQAIRRSVHALSALYAISQIITPDTDVVKLLGNIIDAALTVLKASDGSLLLLDEQSGDLVFTVVRGTLASKLNGYRLPKG